MSSSAAAAADIDNRQADSQEYGTKRFNGTTILMPPTFYT